MVDSELRPSWYKLMDLKMLRKLDPFLLYSLLICIKRKSRSVKTDLDDSLLLDNNGQK